MPVKLGAQVKDREDFSNRGELVAWRERHVTGAAPDLVTLHGEVRESGGKVMLIPANRIVPLDWAPY